MRVYENFKVVYYLAHIVVLAVSCMLRLQFVAVIVGKYNVDVELRTFQCRFSFIISFEMTLGS